MHEVAAHRVRIVDGFWGPRQEMNAQQALDHQWQQLEATHCIDNFRLLADGKDGFREGWFFADSDAYKWLDAACRAYITHPSAPLRQRIDALAGLLARTQEPDGYLFTYNQVHFPGQRWQNLQIEHELYCHGHLIEAAIAHYEATGEQTMLTAAEKAADLLVRDFMEAGPEGTPGHEEIELALIRLYRALGNSQYLELARRFLERRGHIRAFPWHILLQNRSAGERRKLVTERRRRYLSEHPEYTAFRLPAGNVAPQRRIARLRYLLSGLSGQYLQQHRPLRRQTAPVGHAVRFAYLQTAAAMLCREQGDASLLVTLEQAWERMVMRRMYITGGIGSRPEIEGFGRDYELDPELAYAETCAALGSLFWNWEMLMATGAARYADLFEWQLYNAAAAGMGLDGRSYLYNNPLASRGGITRRPWFQVPCCPSNLSRTWASLGRYLFSWDEDALWVHQYVGCQAELDVGGPVRVGVDSGLPWEGSVRIDVVPEQPTAFSLNLRIPSWAEEYEVAINGERVEAGRTGAGAVAERGGQHRPPPRRTASGYSPHSAFYLPLHRIWAAGNTVDLRFGMPVIVRRPDPRVHSCRGRAALTRGPLVYCLESVDNPGLDLFKAEIKPDSLRAESVSEIALPCRAPDRPSSQIAAAADWDALKVLCGETSAGQPFAAIPYYAWANRSESQMNVLVR